VQRLLLGTHTSALSVDGAGSAAAGASSAAAASAAAQSVPQNYLLFAEVRLPRSDGVQVRKAGAAGGADDDDEGAYGAAQGKIEIVQRIPHAGEVNRARYAPHNPDLIATKSPFKAVCVFDRSKHATQPNPADGPIVARPDLLLEGHTEEGYGLQWSPHAEDKGCILSGSNDGLVLLWNVEQAVRERSKKPLGSGVPTPPSLPPLQSFRAHTDVVEDVAWSHFQSKVFASCGDDSRLLLWDSRKGGAGDSAPAAALNDPTKARKAQTASAAAQGNEGHHTGNINCVAFNHFSEHMLASGGSQ
jgi:histone-binding protein RBBP4